LVLIFVDLRGGHALPSVAGQTIITCYDVRLAKLVNSCKR